MKERPEVPLFDPGGDCFSKVKNVPNVYIIYNNICLILDMINYKEYILERSLILFADFYKAFDTVGHQYIIPVEKNQFIQINNQESCVDQTNFETTFPYRV